jgi:predicted dehydrogenase
MSDITIGVIGAGIMGERMLRAAIDPAPTSVRVGKVWDPSEPARARIAAALPVAIADSAEALIAASDCVYIASPPASHLAHAGAALAAGKAIFCEKPLATDLAAAGAFLATAQGARAAVNFPMATSFSAERIAAWLAEGAIGTPQSLAIEVAFRLWPRPWQHGAVSWLDGRAEGGFTREVVSHFLFLTRRLAGPLSLLESTVSFPEDGNSERAITATLSAGAIAATLTGGVGTTEKDDHNIWALTGSSGAIRLRDWAIAERLVDGVWTPDGDAMPNERARPLVLQRQLAAVAAMTRGQPHPLATLQEAFDVQRVVESILSP